MASADFSFVRSLVSPSGACCNRAASCTPPASVCRLSESVRPRLTTPSPCLAKRLHAPSAGPTVQTKRGSKAATSLLLFCSSMMMRYQGCRRQTCAQLLLSTTAIRSPLPPRAPRMIVTDSALDGSGGLWLAGSASSLYRCSAGCRAGSGQRGCGRGAGAEQRCVFKDAALGEDAGRRRRARTSRGAAGGGPRHHKLVMIFARDMREASNRRAWLTKHHHQEGMASWLAKHARTAFLECWGSLARRRSLDVHMSTPPEVAAVQVCS